ncbi:LOW QUALITY PROTEIN: probable cytochrome P450 313a1 [Drosophila eugracilis]|uniref:LOW QUALITY PROTEIN: probable cytochrome P450 313a1 n=1 Tax=Drosophila eugracilis TaxID=29029 RepID=UPI001BD9A790|nr:LOW QUALITY PROTEIN: probable cytochrome P450 313a1 [Drosophila eugracilis]
MLTINLLLAAGLLFWIYFLWSRRRLYMLMLRMPGPIGLPILGSSLENIITFKRKISFRGKYLDKYGSTILTWMGPVPFMVTRDPKIVEDAFTSTDCHNKSSHVADAITTCMGFGLLGLQDPEWIDRRKHLNPSFKQDILLSFFHIFDTETKTLMKLLDSYVNQGEKDLVPDMLRWSFRIAAQTTMGSDVKDDEHFRNDSLVESFESLICLTTLNILMPLVQNKLISKICGYETQRANNLSKIHKMLDNVVKKKIDTTIERHSDPEANIVINRAIELYRKGDIAYKDVKSECCIMIAAGYDTSALTVYHALFLLATHPEHQDAVFEELNAVFPTAGDFEIVYSDLQKLEYLERVMKETLRLIPAIPITARETKQDVQLSNGLLIPKGVVIGIDIFHTHRNPEVWGPEAASFNPDNFLPENIEKRHPYAFVPFARGKRNCIGSKYAMMSSKFALARILRNYQINTSFPFKDLVYVDNMTMKLAKYPRLELQRRT